MAKIKELFDPNKDIYRTIEQVITYDSSQEDRLRAEISEYVVTDSIEEQFEKLLMKMQTAMEVGGQNEIGVWVSGFYGSGKSSFTKYLGLALDENIKIDGFPFLKYLQDRMNKPQTKALLPTVAKRFPPAVVFLDLASEMVAGATMEDVSTVLYYKVLQWAGYSRNLKVAAFERKLKKDGRYKEFTQKIFDQLGVEWTSVQNDPLVIDSLIPQIAHQIYPKLFRTPDSLTTETSDIIQFETERVREMINIVRETTGKEYIIFIIDEVGQYVGSRSNLILNLDGLAKNLKNIGDGKVWIIGTAQQTLTEDDPRAAINSPELYKLKDRFPIKIDLESSDIKEICYRRLLEKSPNAEMKLGDIFDSHGQSLRYNTKLQGAKYYDSDFDKDTFVNLYPFLPAHFDILLHLLGALAKSTGGIGLRSAIKVIQDILVEGADGHSPVAKQPIGQLVTTVTLYDALEKDIRRAFPDRHQSVEKALKCYEGKNLHQEVAKTVAVLQILGNLPATVHNVASLMHSSIDASSRIEEVEKAVDDLLSDPQIPFGEQDGSLCFYSDTLMNIEKERAEITLRSVEIRRIFNEALSELFSPLPSTRLIGTLTVTTGLKAKNGSITASLAGDHEIIQTVVQLVEPSSYESVRVQLLEDSRHKSSQHIIYLLGRKAPEIHDLAAEIYRSREISRRYRNNPEQEVKKYCAGQFERASKLAEGLRHNIERCLVQGSFIFRGQMNAVESIDNDLSTASKKHLAEVAAQVFERYNEAPVRAETSLAEKFLRIGNLKAVTSKLDPLGLVQVHGGTPSIKTDHKALLSVRDYIDRNGTVEGKRLTEHFTGAPFGWSQDTLRYLVAVQLVAGEIKLNVSGREISVNGQQAIDALKTNNSFKNVGVALRGERPSNDVLVRAAERLTDLIGDLVVPLEDEISKSAVKNLPRFQYLFAPLESKLSFLGLPGVVRIRSLNREIHDVLITDASDAPLRFGGEESSLYEGLKWAGEVKLAFKQGLEKTIDELQRHRKEIRSLPASGIPGKLQEELADTLDFVEEWLSKDDFYKHAPDLNTKLTFIEAQTSNAALKMAEKHKQTLEGARQKLCSLREWEGLTQEEQSDILEQLDGLGIAATEDLTGLKQLISQEFVINNKVCELKGQIQRIWRERQGQISVAKNGETEIKCSVSVPSVVTTEADLDELILSLQNIRNKFYHYGKVEVTINIKD